MQTYEGKIDGAALRIGVVVSRFNSAVTERLLAGAKSLIQESTSLDDYQINFGSNPNLYNWRFGMGFRQMRLSQTGSSSLTGIFDAPDVNPALPDDANNGLSDAALTAAGYTLRSGSANGYDAIGVVGASPDTVRLLYQQGAQNTLNGVQINGGYQFFPESEFNVLMYGRAGIFHNRSSGNVGEYLIGSVNDNSVYQRTFNGTRNGVAFGGTLGIKGDWALTQYISLSAGYEANLLANVALAQNQLHGLSNNTFGDRVYLVNNGNKLVFHGLTLGLTLFW